jgi:hypothetical protein
VCKNLTDVAATSVSTIKRCRFYFRHEFYNYGDYFKNVSSVVDLWGRSPPECVWSEISAKCRQLKGLCPDSQPRYKMYYRKRDMSMCSTGTEFFTFSRVKTWPSLQISEKQLSGLEFSVYFLKNKLISLH